MNKLLFDEMMFSLSWIFTASLEQVILTRSQSVFGLILMSCVISGEAVAWFDQSGMRSITPGKAH